MQITICKLLRDGSSLMSFLPQHTTRDEIHRWVYVDLMVDKRLGKCRLGIMQHFALVLAYCYL